MVGGLRESDGPVGGRVDDAFASRRSDKREVVLAYEVWVAQKGFFTGELRSKYVSAD